MVQQSPHEIFRALFLPLEGRKRWWQRPGKTKNNPKVEMLVTMVLDLFMEVEALRATLEAADAGAKGKESAYGRAYRSTAYLTHNSCGLDCGTEKLLGLFYPTATEGTEADPRIWRESLMLRRLGFSEEAISAFKQEAEEAELFT